MNRQKLVLFMLLLLCAAAVVWAVVRYPRQKTVATLTYPPGVKLNAQSKRADSRKNAPADDRILRIALLDSQTGGFTGYRRNIFKPIFIDEQKLMKEKASAVKLVQPPPLKKIEPPLPPAPETPQRALARFTFLGYMKKDGKQTIFLTKDKDILLVKKGDVFAGRYEATAITEQALTISVTDSGEEIVIPLIENRPLGGVLK